MKIRRTPALILASGVILGTLPLFGLPAFYESFLYLLLSWLVLATS